MTFRIARIASCVAAASLALAAAAPASAAPVVNEYFLLLNFGPGLTQNALLFDVFAESGTSFIDNFIFNPPPPQADVEFTFLSEFLGAQQEIAFTGFSLAPYQPGQTPVPVALNAVGGSFFGSGSTLAPLDSGTYVLQIRGTTLVDGAAFDGALATAMPVPEPADWALMAMGLGVVGMVMRRRQQPTA